MAHPPAVQIPQLLPLKQIRFVNNEGHPPPKRRRINAACRTCRKRKTRCDGKKPLCSTCTENGHECMGYEDSNVKRACRSSDAGRMNNDEEDGHEEEKEEHEDMEKSAVEKGHGRQQQRAQGNCSELDEGGGRTVSKHQRYFTQKSLKPKQKSMIDNGQRGYWKIADYKESDAFSDDDESSTAEHSSNSNLQNYRVPYFRYFGPTAIVPGFKQVVVSVREHGRSIGSSSVAISPGSNGPGGGGSARGGTYLQPGGEMRSSIKMPIYDQNDPLPVNRLIIHIIETFFAHLGSNYPFLRQRSFIQRVEEKSVEPILVDAVCALAARFSDHPLLFGHHDKSLPKSEYGNAFAQRAKAAVVDTFPCPTVAAVQACLLLAYEGFGANQDSALWMYLGCAIRMAVDLGLQKLDGVKHQGLEDSGYHRYGNDSAILDTPPQINRQEMKALEQERIDTLWAVFMLDRVISSGTGRSVALRDEDLELTFPEITRDGGWPNPFPALIQIVHLYGRVTDLLNNIRDAKDVTPKKIESLQGMEKDLTELYQTLDQKLTFNATNFQHYVKSGEGTNFILVHFWFHTLIMLVHQPTLMRSFEGQILSLLPHSRELSMSSAKTIADILAFAEIIDPGSFIGNAFTSQPMYIAASAFLMETAAHTSQPASRDASPPRNDRGVEPSDRKGKITSSEQKQKQKQKHTLLASAANQNYQKCYKALQQLETYWAGTRYLLVALDQKAKGIWDPETFTEQEYESTKVKPDLMHWQKKLNTNLPKSSRLADLRSSRSEHVPGSPAIDSSQAIGWSLTGTTNSPNSNLTFMYQQMENTPPHPPPPPSTGNMIYDPIRQSLPEATTASSTSASNYTSQYSSSAPPRPQTLKRIMPLPTKHSLVTADHASTSDAEMLLGLQYPYSHGTPTPYQSYSNTPRGMRSPHDLRYDSGSYDFSQGGNVGDMMLESQEIDVSSLGGEIMPWLEYLPQDVLNFFDSSGNSVGISNASNNVEMDGVGTGGSA